MVGVSFCPQGKKQKKVKSVKGKKLFVFIIVDFEACAVYNYCHGGPIIISTDNLSIPGFFPNSDVSIGRGILYLSHYLFI